MTNRGRRWAGLCCLIAGLIALSACGEQSESTTETPSTKPALVGTQVDTTPQENTPTLTAVAPPANKPVVKPPATSAAPEKNAPVSEPTQLPASIALAPSAPIESAQQLRDRIVEAYRRIETYQSEISFSIVQKAGRWDMIQRGDLYVAFDRANGRFMLDKPDLRLVVEDGRLLLKSYKIEGRHLETDAPASMQYHAIQMEAPHYAAPHLPDVVFLLSAEPLAQIVNHNDHELILLPPDEDDPHRRPGLLVQNFMGTWTFRVDPQTYLIRSAAYSGPELGTDQFSVQKWEEFEIHITQINEPIEREAFEIPLADSQAVESLRDLIAGPPIPPPAPDGDDDQAQAGQGNHPLAGKAAPALALSSLDGQAFSLADQGDQLVLLVFWASWDANSRAGLNAAQNVHDWAGDEGRPVVVAAVNIGESAEQVGAFIKEHDITLPVLLDSENEFAQTYQVGPLPQIVMVHQGRITYANFGVSPNMADQLKTLIRKQLGDSPRPPEEDQPLPPSSAPKAPR